MLCSGLFLFFSDCCAESIYLYINFSLFPFVSLFVLFVCLRIRLFILLLVLFFVVAAAATTPVAAAAVVVVVVAAAVLSLSLALSLLA